MNSDEGSIGNFFVVLFRVFFHRNAPWEGVDETESEVPRNPPDDLRVLSGGKDSHKMLAPRTHHGVCFRLPPFSQVGAQLKKNLTAEDRCS